jgi:hypothetical protein
MTEKKQINVSIKYNLLIGLITGIWLFVFLFLIKPFKQEKLDKIHLFYIAISMCLVTILCYFIIIIIQNNLYKKYRKWNLKYEIIVMSIFLALTLIGSFIIYKSGITNGSYNLQIFFFKNYLPTVLILFPIILILRRYFLKLSSKKVEQNIIYIYGKNKLDYVKMNRKDLISISSAQNYVEISFLINNQLHKKLIRISLKKVHLDLPFLKKVHRSHLINPTHFISFLDKKNLQLTMKEIPFSDMYKNNIILN